MIMSIALIEEFFDNNICYIIAKTVLKAQDIYEGSWDNDSHKYTISHMDAADTACTEIGLKKEWSKYIAHWNIGLWNDIQGWANIFIKNSNTINHIHC